MGTGKGNKIKLEQNKGGNSSQYFIDYYKYKAPDGFLLEFMEDFVGDKTSLLVIDSNNFYAKNHADAENRIRELKKIFAASKLAYEEVITEKEADKRIFGIKLQNSKMVNSYKLGLAVTKEQIINVTNLVKDYNLFYFVPSIAMEPEEIIQQFLNTGGNYEKLNRFFEYELYHDCNFRRMRISSKTDLMKELELKLMKY
ncbi:hypothetical protein QA584_05835 [Anaerocolumna sp. AGMB13025]|uniref:hypothetical protein n=1 Tax=Anaerocolumna sp. AGMB13025 TaxID=3039116 RepID=UPI00241F88E6|nr:hypothetical protein [Anaerocolumna sp. AGMB13025]WFR58592.1 hypothetical protein QA584_05835 [Anaerocolumna sp. AGMB13025]